MSTRLLWVPRLDISCLWAQGSFMLGLPGQKMACQVGEPVELQWKMQLASPFGWWQLVLTFDTPWSWTGSLTLKRLVYINYEVNILGILYIYLPKNMRHLPYLLNDLPKSCWILEIRMYTLPKNEYSHLKNWWLGDGPFPFPSFSFLGPGKFQGRFFFLRCRNCRDLSRCTSTLVECAKPMEVSNLRVFLFRFPPKSLGEESGSQMCMMLPRLGSSLLAILAASWKNLQRSWGGHQSLRW